MSSHYQLAVIGSGPGGYVAALKAASMGASTAIVEKGDLGGTCLNFGCIPSKALLASAELMHHIRHADTMGVKVEGAVTCQWDKVQTRKDKILKTLRGGIGSLFKARKVDLYNGYGRLDGAGTIAVEGKDAGTITADNVILAVGSEPARIPGWPDDPNVVCTSDESLHWKDLPKKLLIVGGGIIGCEFACMLEPLGVEVTVVEMLPRLLPTMDHDLGNALQKVFKKRKITCYTDTKVDALELVKDGAQATFSNGKKGTFDRVLVAIGRRPATKDCGLESVGLTTDRGFLRVDDYMQTPVAGHYCIGDANGRALLAHAASAQGIAAVNNALGDKHPFTSPIPGAVYTFPEVAAVGMTHLEAREKGIPVAVGMFPLSALGKAMAVNDTDGFVKVLRHRETGALVGVHMLGHNVTECIAAAGALLHQKVSVHDVAETVFAHPTISEALKESAEDALGMAVHLPPRKVLRATAGVA